MKIAFLLRLMREYFKIDLGFPVAKWPSHIYNRVYIIAMPHGKTSFHTAIILRKFIILLIHRYSISTALSEAEHKSELRLT